MFAPLMKIRTRLLYASLHHFRSHLEARELAPATVDKYLRDATRFVSSAKASNAHMLSKRAVVDYKASLVSRYAPASVNCMLTSINSYLEFAGRPDLKARLLKVQRETYRDSSRELTRTEYDRLVDTAMSMGRDRTALAMQTLCAMGIRVSELRFVTIEAVREGRVVISNKGKVRYAWVPENLRRVLSAWADANSCTSGPVFRTRSGRPLDRSYIWREMKTVAEAARIEGRKVYPHNLRHVFAVVHYDKYRDLAALCDLLGHERIETTRIYLATAGERQREQVRDLGLVA